VKASPHPLADDPLSLKGEGWGEGVSLSRGREILVCREEFEGLPKHEGVQDRESTLPDLAPVWTPSRTTNSPQTST
jgi:hypothetical protein